MPNVNDVFPTKYLSAGDLKGQTVRLTIGEVTVETLGQGRQAQQKPVLYFRGKTKGLALNKTNTNAIAAVYGPETDDWIGAEIDVYPTKVEYAGDQVDAIRLKVVPPRAAGRVAAADSQAPLNPAPAPAGRYDERNPPPVESDSVPF
ncbi:MAG: hypothetical protein WC869_11805 [Phycisphaerae bacterium]|jgi:hypothetical protein